MINTVLEFLKKNQITLLNKKIVAAISTGVDSMVLLDMLINLKKEYNLLIYVAHVNHHQREQSDLEEVYIKSFCKQHNIECFVHHLNKVNDDNFQDFAHRERLLFFKKSIHKVQADYLFLGHHANDNIETVLMRIMRGSNLKGYAGINPIIKTKEYIIVRPFAEILKDDIIAYAHKRAIKYFQDETNIQDKYTRNRIRKNIIPLLFEEDENVHQKFLEFSKTVNGAWDVVTSFVLDFIKNNVIITKQKITFTIDAFNELSKFLQNEVLFYLLKEYQFGKSNIDEIIKLITSSKKNHKLYYKNLFTFVKEYNVISILKYKLNKLKCDFEVNEIGQYYVNDSMTINVIKSSDFNILKQDELWYNSAMLPIRIRTRKPGDRILLSAGYKKVKDILIDKKIGIIKRDDLLIVEKDEEILAVLGVVKSKYLQVIKEKDILIKVECYDK